jgi:hypothetical protein
MASCDVRVEVDSVAAAGGTLAGHVVCHASEAVAAKAVTLTVGWQAHGRGNRDMHVAHEATLHSGAINGEQRLPFSVALPNGPVSFHGELVNVEWFARARIDLAWEIDPTFEATFTLVPGASAQRYVHGDRQPALGPQSARPEGRSFGCLLLFLIPFFVLGAAAMIFGPRLFGAIFLAVPSVIGVAILWGRIAARKAGDVEVSATTYTPRAGEALALTVRMLPAQSFELNDVVCTLYGSERAVSGSDSTRDTHTHEISKRTVSLAAGRRHARVGEPIELSGTIAVPADAPPSFFSRNNEVIWRVDVRVDIPSWPDWTDSVVLAVLPKGAA